MAGPSAPPLCMRTFLKHKSRSTWALCTFVFHTSTGLICELAWSKLEADCIGDCIDPLEAEK